MKATTKKPRLSVGTARVRAQIRELSAACVDVKPQSIDWRDASGDDGEGWEFWELTECETCHEKVVVKASEEQHRYADSESNCHGSLGSPEGPMMSYWYPIDKGLNGFELAKELGTGCLCVVRVGDEFGLALTGGGMDLSWEICESFIKLGYLPPFHFCGLPAMCGRGTSNKDLFTIAACKQTCTVVANRAHWRKEELSMLSLREKERIARSKKKSRKVSA